MNDETVIDESWANSDEAIALYDEYLGTRRLERPRLRPQALSSKLTIYGSYFFATLVALTCFGAAFGVVSVDSPTWLEHPSARATRSR